MLVPLPNKLQWRFERVRPVFDVDSPRGSAAIHMIGDASRSFRRVTSSIDWDPRTCIWRWDQSCWAGKRALRRCRLSVIW
jgi:hypothetical protein